MDIKDFRKMYGLTLSEMAKISGIPASTISDVENKKFKSSKRFNEIMCFINLYRSLKLSKIETANAINSYQKNLELSKKSIFQKIKEWFL